MPQYRGITRNSFTVSVHDNYTVQLVSDNRTAFNNLVLNGNNPCITARFLPLTSAIRFCLSRIIKGTRKQSGTRELQGLKLIIKLQTLKIVDAPVPDEETIDEACLKMHIIRDNIACWDYNLHFW